MEGVAPREDLLHNPSLNQLKPQFNYINKASIVRAQSSSYFKPNNSFLATEVNHPGQHGEDSEISIFDAEKYFNGAHEPRENNNNKKPDAPSMSRLSLSAPKQSISSVSRLSSISDDGYGRSYRGRSSHATPTASSEASWNSQTGLLTNPPGLSPVSIRNLPTVADRNSRKTNASMKWLLRGNRCPCSGKKSVNVEETNSESEASKTPQRIVQLHRIKCSGGGSLFSSRQSSPKTSPHYTRGLTKSIVATTRSNLIPDEPIKNFIARPQLEQNKVVPTNTNPNLDDLRREKSFPSDRVAVTVRTFAEGSGTTSNGFTFPILNNSATQPKRMFNIVPPISVSGIDGSNVEPRRDSLEIFQPQGSGVGRNFTLPASPKSRRPSYEDEICSDASSDLFEIESFSATTQSTLFPRRDSLDDPATNFNVRRLQIATINKKVSPVAGIDDHDDEDLMTPSIAPTECYPPSEVSVDWSVTTAEGFDRASLASFSVSASEVGYAAMRKSTKPMTGGISGDGESKRRGNGGLLTSCRREKAVNVGPGPIKFRQSQRSGT